MRSSVLPRRSSVPAEYDPFEEHLVGTSDLARERALAREAWFASLGIENKQALLFEFDTLLRGVRPFRNPKNHPGPAKRGSPAVQDFSEAMGLLRDALLRAGVLARALQGPQVGRASVAQKYIRALSRDDSGFVPSVDKLAADRTLERDLSLLRESLDHLAEVGGALARLQRVSFRTFEAFVALVESEVAQAPFFAPGARFGFRPEFDRVTNPGLLEITRSAPGEETRELVAVTVLSLVRMLRTCDLAEQMADRTQEAHALGGLYVVLSALRSDARTFVAHLKGRVGASLGVAYERNVLRVPAKGLERKFDALVADGERLLELKAAFEGIAGNLRQEVRRAFEHELPWVNAGIEREKARAGTKQATAMLRPALENAVLLLGHALGVRLEEKGLFTDVAARISLSERLRRDVWMFAQVVRAFVEKVRTAEPREIVWNRGSPLAFVREFLHYFRSMGYPLLHAADFPRIQRFMDAVGLLDDADLLDEAKLRLVIAEAEESRAFLNELFDRLDQREELHGRAFDRQQAVRSLRLYLGAHAEAEVAPM